MPISKQPANKNEKPKKKKGKKFKSNINKVKESIEKEKERKNHNKNQVMELDSTSGEDEDEDDDLTADRAKGKKNKKLPSFEELCSKKPKKIKIKSHACVLYLRKGDFAKGDARWCDLSSPEKRKSGKDRIRRNWYYYKCLNLECNDGKGFDCHYQCACKQISEIILKKD